MIIEWKLSKSEIKLVLKVLNIQNFTNNFFFVYKFITMHHNPQNYLNHTLNNSLTKQTFSFSRAQRFLIQKRASSNNMYTLPNCNTGRSCGFGYGTKTSLVEKQKSPPPGAYQSSSDFKKVTRYNTISFHMGRNKIKFGSFIYDSEKRKFDPSPNTYLIKSTHLTKKGGKMAIKLPTQIDLLIKKKNPGPGTYKLNVTDMKSSGSYIISDYKNCLSPKYQSPNKRSRSRSPENKKSQTGPGKYDISSNFGQSIVSKFRNSIASSFSRESRPGLQDKTKKNFPGFKYKRFSQFCGTQS